MKPGGQTVPVALIVALFAAAHVASAQPRTIEEATRLMQQSDPRVRQALFDLLQPVVLTNCDLERFGEPHDGGYLLCRNLLGRVQAAYSYGISGYDKWGCDVSTRLRVRLHQYDCFDTRQPPCPGGDSVFHAECVSNVLKKEEGRVFDTMRSQFAKNGHSEKRLVVKMDVEAAEWDVILDASDETLDQIDQLAIELHFVHEERYAAAIRRLKEFFHLAHLHINNFSCAPGIEPFPGWAYEALFVNKRLAKVDPARTWSGVHAQAAPNAPQLPDCQVAIKTP
jgi:hypothetical protein